MIGTLDQRIEIRSVAPTTADGAGGFTEATTLVKTVWAKIENIGGRESAVSQQTQSMLLSQLIIRKGGTMPTPQMFVIVRKTGARLEIEKVAPYRSSRHYLEMTCKEIVGA